MGVFEGDPTGTPVAPATQPGVAPTKVPKPQTPGSRPLPNAQFERWVMEAAQRWNIKPELIRAILHNESSSLNARAVGDNGSSFGLAQIHQSFRPEFFDPHWSINYIAQRMAGFRDRQQKRGHKVDDNALILQHNRPDAAWRYVSGQLTAEQADRLTGTGHYLASAKAYLTGTSVNFGGGGGSVGGSSAFGSANATLSFEDLAAKYGYVAAFFQQSPELQKLLQAAVAGQWSVEKFQAELQKTTWFRTHSDTEREWSKVVATDPKSAQRLRDIRKIEVQRLAREMGVAIDPKRLGAIVEDSLRFGYDAERLRELVGAEFRYKPGDQSGQVGDLQDTFRQMVAEYGSLIPEDTIGKWLQRIVNGKATEQDFQNYVTKVAKSRYPGLAEDLDRGVTVREAAEPFRAMLAQSLEIDPATIDMNDPWVKQALDFRDAKGNAGVMPLWQFERAVKDDPRWLKTNNARDSVLGAAHQVLADLGLAY